ncbi:MAG: GNAT family N-acetyltransferase [Thermoplasmatota archaeon]
MDLNIRPASEEDLSAMTRIYNHYVEHTPVTFDVRPFEPRERLEWFRAHTRGAGRLLLAAESRGVVVAFAGTGTFRPKPGYDTTVEASVYCDPAFVGRGVGRALYDKLFGLLDAAPVHSVVAGIALPNRGSVALHEAHGFRLLGTFHEVGYKFGRFWDVAWFERVAAPDATGEREADH